MSNKVKTKTRSMIIILYFSFLISIQIVFYFCKQSLKLLATRLSSRSHWNHSVFYCFAVSFYVLIFYVLQVRLVKWKDLLIVPVGLFFRLMFLFHSCKIISQLEFYVVFKYRCLQQEKYLSIPRDGWQKLPVYMRLPHVSLQILFFSGKTK